MAKTTKNEKVIHTRISKELFNKVLDKARKNRISTSNLIRNLVEDSLEIHDEVWEAVDRKIKNYLVSESDPIIGFQPIILNTSRKCSGCGAKLKPGKQAFVGVREKVSPKLIVCRACSEKQAEISEPQP